jgi:hypothetical protein
MPGAAGNEVGLSRGTRERLDRMALAVGMTGDELASTFVVAVATAIVEASRSGAGPASNVIPFPLKR